MSFFDDVEIRYFNDRSLLMRFNADATSTQRHGMISLAATAREMPGVIDAIAGHSTIVVECDPHAMSDIADRLRGQLGDTSIEPAGRSFDVIAIYDGPDLDWVAQHCGLSVEEVVKLHTAPAYLVSMIGSPGFIYLDGLDARLRVPRLDEPRTKVEAGAVGIGGGHSGIYGKHRPGGWRLIARLESVPDVSPGDQLRFSAR